MSELWLSGVNLCSRPALTSITTISNFKFEKLYVNCIALDGNSKKIMILFIIANDNRQRETNLSIILILVLAKTYNEQKHITMVSYIFSLIVIVM